MARRSTLLVVMAAATAAASSLACHSTDSGAMPQLEIADAAPPSTDPPVPGDAADAGRDAGRRDAGRDAAPTVVLNGWTAETTTTELFVKAGQPHLALLADPQTPRRLLLRLDAVTASTDEVLALVWNDGVWSKPLRWRQTSSPSFLPEAGGGLGSDGKIYERIEASSSGGMSSVHFGVFEGATWTWWRVDQGFGSWPPRRMHVMPGSPARLLLQTSSSLIEPKPWLPSDTYPIGGDLGALALSPDRVTYLATKASAQGLRRCTITTGACTDVGSSGFDPQDTLREISISPANADRVSVHARGPMPSSEPTLYVSKDGGATFARVPLPSPMLRRTPLGSVNDPETWVVEASSTTKAAELFVTRDAGATWVNIPLPQTTVVDISGLALDAANTLFLVRAGQLFSRAL